MSEIGYIKDGKFYPFAEVDRSLPNYGMPVYANRETINLGFHPDNFELVIPMPREDK